MQKLQLLIKELESKIPDLEITSPSVSASPVGWHIDHALLTIIVIIKGMENSDPKAYRRTLNLKRTLVFTINKIPRRRIQAPPVVQPRNNCTVESLKNSIISALEQLQKANTLEKNKYIHHPFFNKLNVKATLKFLAIHTNHHLGIINDIIKAGKKS